MNPPKNEKILAFFDSYAIIVGVGHDIIRRVMR
jgi:hypothetical protein